MKWPLILAWFVLQQSCIQGVPLTGCQFPPHWSGSWFQSGVVGMVVVNGTNISTKGRCLQGNGEKYLIFQDSQCIRCIVMHEKHPNVLQFKETLCLTSVTNLGTACDNLAGDAVLFSLFRSGAPASPCPIRGPLEFTYSLGGDGKECSSTSSFAETCTQDSRLLLRYLACPEVSNTESTDVELECLATWKEGSTQYLVARRFFRKTKLRQSNDEELYRCFIYAKASNDTWQLAESGDATCSALYSVTEGARTLTMKQRPVQERCSFPIWLVSTKLWIALDSSTLLASTHNMTILDHNETHLSCHKLLRLDDRQQTMRETRREDQVMIVAKVTRGCDNGYVCLVLHKRDDPVVEMQLSEKWTQEPEEACNSSKFDYLTAPHKTYITSDLTTRQCPYLGQYEVVFVMRAHVNGEYGPESFGSDGDEGLSQDEDNVAQVRKVRTTSTTPFPMPCQATSLSALDIGCERSDRMKFPTSCSDETLSEYRCHGTWVEDDRAYLVASTESRRYCLVYSASAASSGSRELSVTGHLGSCPRPSHGQPQHAWTVNLTSYAQCGNVSSSSTRTSQSSIGMLGLTLGSLLARWVAR